MKNLKKILALVLALTTVFGCSVTASAAATDFTDYDEIDNKEAVEVMNALNVIGGYNTGDFKPDGYLTRAEMCKMVAFVMNGGKAPVLGTTAVTTYSDIKGHWAQDYIEYATSMGIVSGVGGGKFNPNGNLTGTQAAKMMLTAMGYNAEVFGFVGNGWDVNINRYANEAGLYDGLSDLQPNLPITRDQAAQLMYNAILAGTMELSWNQSQTTGEITQEYRLNKNETLFGEKFDGIDAVGYLTEVSHDSGKDVYTYDLSNSTVAGEDVATPAFDTESDYTGLYGQKVRTLYTVKSNGDVVLYGMFAKDSSVIYEGYQGDLSGSVASTDNRVKVGDTTYRLDATAGTTPVYTYNSGAAAGMLDNLANAPLNASTYSFKMIDTDADSRVDRVVVYPFTVNEVTYVGNSTVTFKGMASQETEDLLTYEGMAKDDVVKVVSSANADKDSYNYTVTKAEVKTGTITGEKDVTINGVAEKQLLIDGKWYTNKTAEDNLMVSDTINYVAYGSVLYYAKVTSDAQGIDSLTMVYDVAWKAGTGTAGTVLEAKMIFADGTTKTVVIDEINGVDMEYAAGTMDDVTTDTITGGVDVNGTAVPAATIQNTIVGEMMCYNVNNSGNYELETIPANYNDHILGFDGSTAARGIYNNTTETIAGKEVANDAVIFVFVGDAPHTADRDNAAYVYTGQELKNTGANYGLGNTTYASALYSEVDGFTYAKAAVLNNSEKPNIVKGTNYGYLVSNVSRLPKEDGKDYIGFSYWNGTEIVAAKALGTNTGDFKAGDVITFDITSNDGDVQVIRNVSVPKTMVTTYVTGWDGVKKIALSNGGNKEITDDTVILYVDSNDKAGREGDIGRIAIGEDVDLDGKTNNNVRYIPNGTNGLAFLLVDVDNDMQPAPTVPALSGSVSDTDIENALTNGSAEVDLSEVTTGTLNVDVAEGQKLTVTANPTGTASLNITMTDGAELALPAAPDKITVVVKDGATVKIGNTTVIGTGAAIDLSTLVFRAGRLAAGQVELTATSGNIVVELNNNAASVNAQTLISNKITLKNNDNAIISTGSENGTAYDISIDTANLGANLKVVAGNVNVTVTGSSAHTLNVTGAKKVTVGSSYTVDSDVEIVNGAITKGNIVK